MSRKRAAWIAALASLAALIVLGLAWELWLAPLKPGGSWLVLKILPLMAPVFGLLHGRRYTFQWTTLLVWLYVAEGAVRAYSDSGMAARLAVIEIAISLAYFAAAVVYVRSTSPASRDTSREHGGTGGKTEETEEKRSERKKDQRRGVGP